MILFHPYRQYDWNGWHSIICEPRSWRQYQSYIQSGKELNKIDWLWFPKQSLIYGCKVVILNIMLPYYYEDLGTVRYNTIVCLENTGESCLWSEGDFCTERNISPIPFILFCLQIRLRKPWCYWLHQGGPVKGGLSTNKKTKHLCLTIEM